MSPRNTSSRNRYDINKKVRATMSALNLLTFSLYAAACFPQAPDAESLKSIALQYDVNRTSIQQGGFRFRQVVGKARDLGQAADGQLDAVSYEMDGILAIDRGRVRYDLVHLDLKAVTQDMGVDPIRGARISSTPAQSTRNIFDGRSTIQDLMYLVPDTDTIRHLPIRTAGPEMLLRDYAFPLALGPLPDPFGLRSDIENAIEGRDGASVKSLEPTDMEAARVSECTAVRLGSRDGDRVYLVDRKRGAIPLRVDWKGDPKKGLWRVLDHIQQVGPTFVPLRSVLFRGADSQATIITVTSYSVDRPSDNEFTLSFDQPVKLSDKIEKAIYAERARWNHSDLPRHGSPESTPVQSEPTVTHHDQELPGEREPWPTWALISAVLIGSSLMAAILLLRRR